MVTFGALSSWISGLAKSRQSSTGLPFGSGPAGQTHVHPTFFLGEPVFRFVVGALLGPDLGSFERCAVVVAKEHAVLIGANERVALVGHRIDAVALVAPCHTAFESFLPETG